MAKLGTVSMTGRSGKTYELDVYPMGDAFKPLGAVYFLTKRIPIANGEADYTWVYVGESADISGQPFDDAHKACIDANEANSICLLIEGDPARRAAIATDLREAYAPPCNRS